MLPVQILHGQRGPTADLVVETADFSFRTPRSAAEGRTTIRLHNLGPSFHHVVLLRLRRGESRDAVLTRIQSRRGDPDAAIPGATSIGGPEGRMPSGDSYVTVDLAAGEYLIVCTIPADDGVPHAAKGMYVPLTVAARPPRAGSKSAAIDSMRPDIVLRATDYSYTMSRDRVAPGWRLIRVENAGPAEHIAEIARLNAGKTASDALMWASRGFDGAPPMTTVGGTTRLNVGGASLVWLNLAKGRYAIYCMLHGPGDRQHIRLGMIKELIVE